MRVRTMSVTPSATLLVMATAACLTLGIGLLLVRGCG